MPASRQGAGPTWFGPFGHGPAVVAVGGGTVCRRVCGRCAD